ncbi:ABC transporter substrate-binding protein [Ornithinimicrobium avium]|uniref:ABC transporter substrate-binding protein n=1 Tax=Ornithinimicrobium avium TaxID=2283195 RepID=A0A345NNS1_9MICO|nr:ABC transporter substrate-binding protein [Ornithinimicrobium avium]AXH96679.1 ABC transporter substrate-binding protein [Ornithinimicrobium avium]
MTHPRTLRQATALAAALALALTGCATDTGDADSTSGPAAPDAASNDTAADGGATDSSDTTAEDTEAALDAFPVTVDTPAGEVTIQQRPERIVSLSASATEILFAVGAGDQVVAADEWSTYPEEAPTTDLSGYEPNVEAIVSYDPDLVVVANDINDIVASLGQVDVPVIVNAAPADVEGGYDGMAALGLATGHADDAAQAISTMREGMEEAFAAAPTDLDLRIYHEVDQTLFAASSHSFIGSVYAQMGATNIADEGDTEGSGFPQLTEEAIIEANPQLIVIQDLVGYTPEDVAARPGWDQIDAVRNDNIVVVSSDIASRWGPRLPQLVTVVAEAMTAAAVPAGR